MTSRRQLTDLPAAWINLRGLRHRDFMLLLQRIAGADRVASDPDSAAHHLARLASGWPLPLRLVAVRVRNRSQWSLKSIAQQLEHELNNVTGVLHDECVAAEASIARAYNRMRPLQARTLRLAGITEQPEFTTQEGVSAWDEIGPDGWCSRHVEMGPDGRYTAAAESSAVINARDTGGTKAVSGYELAYGVVPEVAYGQEAEHYLTPVNGRAFHDQWTAARNALNPQGRPTP